MNRHSEFVVIGAGLTGLTVATALLHMGRDVAVLEALDASGGLARGGHLGPMPISYGLKRIPANASSQQCLGWLEAILGKKIAGATISETPVTFTKGEFQPFVGFGENAPACAAELLEYLQPDSIELLAGPQDWMSWMTAELGDRVRLGHVVKKIEFQDDIATRLEFDNGTHFSFKNLILAIAPEKIGGLLPEGLLPARTIQRMANSTTWTAISLEMAHTKLITENSAMHLLMGGGEGAHPCVGRFCSLGDHQCSQWLALITAEETMDTEFVAQVLREMKRQIKRAYPATGEKPLHERILLAENSHGTIDLRLDSGRLPKIHNVWVGGRGLEGQRNMISSLSSVSKILNDFSVLNSFTSISKPAPAELSL